MVKAILLALAAMLMFAIPVSAEWSEYTSWYYYEYEDFSNGLNGWSTVSGGADIPVQVFSDTNPMVVTEVYEDNGIKTRPTNMTANAVPSTDGNAIGWAATGIYTGQPVHRISKIFNVYPGLYSVTAYYKASAWHQTRTEQYTVCAKILALVGDDIGRTDNASPSLFNAPLLDPNSTRHTTWNNSWEGNTNGEWVVRDIYCLQRQEMDARDGIIEISLGMYDMFGNDPGEYRWVAFDDVFICIEAQYIVIPEPAGITALLSGIAALSGIAVRRRFRQA